jgi:hypothetical protein
MPKEATASKGSGSQPKTSPEQEQNNQAPRRRYTCRQNKVQSKGRAKKEKAAIMKATSSKHYTAAEKGEQTEPREKGVVTKWSLRKKQSSHSASQFRQSIVHSKSRGEQT